MRQPVERVISLYTHNFVREIEKRPPDVAVFADPQYVDRSRYGVQIRPYLELFGPENVLLLVFEEYTADPIAALDRVAGFLGIDPAPFAETDTTPLHQSVGQPYLRSEALRDFPKSDLFQKIRNVAPAAIRHAISATAAPARSISSDSGVPCTAQAASASRITALVRIGASAGTDIASD